MKAFFSSQPMEISSRKRLNCKLSRTPRLAGCLLLKEGVDWEPRGCCNLGWECVGRSLGRWGLEPLSSNEPSLRSRSSLPTLNSVLLAPPPPEGGTYNEAVGLQDNVESPQDSPPPPVLARRTSTGLQFQQAPSLKMTPQV